MMIKAFLHHFALRFNMRHWFGMKRPNKVAQISHAAIAQHSAKVPIIHPETLRRKETDLSHLAQAPNNTLYELLQLVVANQVASAEIAATDMAILLAFIDAFYKDMPAKPINAATPPGTPTEVAFEELRGLLSARSHVDKQLRGNVDAFLNAWQKMGLDAEPTLGHAPA